MVISKIVSLLSCAFLLGLGLSNAALAIDNSLATDETNTPRHSEREGSRPLVKKDAHTLSEVQTIKGEVLRSEGDQYVVKRSDGKQVSLHVDDTTQVTRTFTPGEWIEAKVRQENNGHHAVSITPAPR
jgi:hypothetical protein